LNFQQQKSHLKIQYLPPSESKSYQIKIPLKKILLIKIFSNNTKIQFLQNFQLWFNLI
jgi:hypothetical protein